MVLVVITEALYLGSEYASSNLFKDRGYNNDGYFHCFFSTSREISRYAFSYVMATSTSFPIR
jgi:hypothetical protein